MPSSVGSEDSDSAARLPREDVSSAECQVCALRSRPPSTPVMPDIQLQSIDDPRATVALVLIDAAGLEYQVTRLRAHNELTAAYNEGLAAHASTLHDRNRALLLRTREGFDLGAVTVNGLNERLESIQLENTYLEDEVERLRARVAQADSLETRYRVLEQSCLKHAYGLQDELAAAQARDSELDARVALLTSPPTDPATPSTASSGDRARLDRVQVELVAAQADLVSTRVTLSAVFAQLATVTAERDQASGVSAEERHNLQVQLARSQRETDSVRQLIAPFEVDVRRVIALLVAHAEELQRDLVRIRGLEASLSPSESARVAAQADVAHAQAEELRASSRADRFRIGFHETRKSAARQYEVVTARVRRLGARVLELE
ncbi:unnamed protein product [Phytophthora fragariaefolia]|uniref:Unnamed protein product n=1 Tax=Phytophthora fragariaefolia TaxID=1490495 RepID=A0A9W6Y012_9STRA|nr:unnamed protein product [Phytophthora fragariaefolia]